MNIIFALPDYSSGVTERHQNLFYGRLINLTLEFDINNGWKPIQRENREKPYIILTIMQGYRRSRKEFSWSRCTVDNVEFSLIYSIIIIINDTLARSLEPVVTECKEHTIHTQTQIVASRKPKEIKHTHEGEANFT